MSAELNSYSVRTHYIIDVQEVIGAEKQYNKVYPTPTGSYTATVVEKKRFNWTNRFG